MTKAEGKKEKNGNQIKVSLTESVHVILEDGERALRAKTASELSGELDKKEGILKIHNEQAKKEIKVLKGRIAEAVQSHNSGREYQSVKCHRIYDVKLKETWLIYKAKEYQRRGMTSDELNKCNKDLFGKADVQLKAPVTKGRNADEIAKDIAAIAKDQKLPPELGNAKPKSKSEQRRMALQAVPDAPKEEEAPSPREDLGYTDPKKNGGKS